MLKKLCQMAMEQTGKALREQDKKNEKSRLSNYSPTIDQSASRSPVELELTRAVGHSRAVELESLVRSVGVTELNETVASISIEGGLVRRREERR